MERVLDRRVRYDEASRNYPARRLSTATTPRSYTWGIPSLDGLRPLDQGVEGACVGHAWAHEAAARPVVRNDADSALAFRVYREAQKIDYWPGEDYEGTSVLAGAKVMQQLGFIGSYFWAFSLNEGLTSVSRHGPGVVGSWWWSGMWNTDSKGYLHPTGQKEGGHAYLLTGISLRYERVTIYNSWGPKWGNKGRAFIDFADFEKLLLDEGELCIPTQRKFALAA